MLKINKSAVGTLELTVCIMPTDSRFTPPFALNGAGSYVLTVIIKFYGRLFEKKSLAESENWWTVDSEVFLGSLRRRGDPFCQGRPCVVGSGNGVCVGLEPQETHRNSP